MLMLSQTINGRWGGDFWLHSAVVRELALHPLHPSHPLFALTKPHIDFSPYSLVVALGSRILKISPVTALAVAGLLNLCLFLLALPLFVRVFTSRATASTTVLLLTLFLWGWHPWTYSGFFHLNVLGAVLPYPSTFATALSFVVIAMFSSYVASGRRVLLGGIFFLVAVVVVSHLIVAFFLCSVLVALCLGPQGRHRPGRTLAGAVVIVGALAVATAWPYYSLVSLVTENAGRYDSSHKALYESVPLRLFPLVLAVPLIYRRLRERPLDPLGTSICALVVLYVYGGLSGNYNFGRLISFAVLLADVAIAAFLSTLTPSIGRRLREGGMAPRIAAGFILVAAVVNMSHGFERSIPRRLLPAKYQRSKPYGSYASLFGGIPRRSVTLATLTAGSGIPAYGGKTVASSFPSPFIADDEARRRDVRRFFSDSATNAQRQDILRKYRVTYILVDRGDSTQHAPLAVVRSLGTVRRAIDGLTLIQVRQTAQRAV